MYATGIDGGKKTSWPGGGGPRGFAGARCVPLGCVRAGERAMLYGRPVSSEAR